MELGRRGCGGRSFFLGREGRGGPAGRVPISEKNKSILVETLSNMLFLWVYPPPISLGPNRWVRHEEYGGPNLGEIFFQLFSIFIV